MALKWVDGFESYSNLVGQIGNRYGTFIAANATFQPGRAIGNSLQMNGTSLITPSLGNQATYVVGFAFQNVNLTTSNVNMTVFEFRDLTTAQIAVTFNPSTRVFSVYSGATLLGVGTFAITPGAWYYIECLCTVSTTVGAVTLKVNNVTQVNLSGSNTQVSANAYSNTFRWAGPVSAGISGAYLLDDVYIVDSTGAMNNTFLGDMKVEAVTVIEHGTYTEWTPNISGIPNYQAVQVLADGLYNQANVPGNRDSFTCTSLFKITGNIAGVSAVVWSRNTDSTQHTISPSVRFAATDYYATAITITDTAFKAYQNIWETNPNTTIAWTVADVGNSEFGVQLVS